MKAYTNRTYRQRFRDDRWHGFVAKYKETDVWIGVDKKSFHREMPKSAEQIIYALREEADAYLKHDPLYVLSLMPYRALDFAPILLKEMSDISFQTGVGPMATVAGAFAERTARELKKRFEIQEIIVENGGDIYADIQRDIEVAVFAGESPLSDKIGLRIDAKESPLGICTSSGTVGPSLSFGKADAVMIVCRNAALADGYASVFANKIQTSEDISPVMEQIEQEKNILSALVVKDNKLGIVGQFEMTLFR